jgi:hypothetical protein
MIISMEIMGDVDLTCELSGMPGKEKEETKERHGRERESERERERAREREDN